MPVAFSTGNSWLYPTVVGILVSKQGRIPSLRQFDGFCLSLRLGHKTKRSTQVDLSVAGKVKHLAELVASSATQASVVKTSGSLHLKCHEVPYSVIDQLLVLVADIYSHSHHCHGLNNILSISCDRFK